jgi:hypothetical protein
MKTAEHVLPAAVVTALQEARCEGPRLFLAGQLPRDLYTQTAKAILLLGGKWVRAQACHVFPDDCEQAVSLAVLTGRVTDFKKTFQVFETPERIADELVSLARLDPVHSILEPSAGRGAIVRAINRAMRPYKNPPTVQVCEIYDRNVAILQEQFGLDPLVRDFMGLPAKLKFDRIVMNPPFRNGQDILHLCKAYEHLNDGGRVVCITYPGWAYRTEGKYKVFRTFLESMQHYVTELTPGSFSESGTEIATKIIIIDKP